MMTTIVPIPMYMGDSSLIDRLRTFTLWRRGSRGLPSAIRFKPRPAPRRRSRSPEPQVPDRLARTLFGTCDRKTSALILNHTNCHRSGAVGDKAVQVQR